MLERRICRIDIFHDALEICPRHQLHDREVSAMQELL